jgi:hypothetical protein
MKNCIILVLSIIVSLLASGCIGTGVATAGVYVTNNIDNVTMVIESTRGEVLNSRIRTGDKAFVPVSGFPGGNQFTVMAKVYSPEGKYLGIAQYHDYISFDASGRYGRNWVVDSYNAITRDWSATAASAHGVPEVPQTPPAPRPVGSLQVISNLADVKVVVTSSEDNVFRLELTTGQSNNVPIGIKPETRQVTLMAKVYSKTDEYLGYKSRRDSIDESRGFGTDQVWIIESFTPVRTQAKR